LRYTHIYQKDKEVWASFFVSIPFAEEFDCNETGQSAWLVADKQVDELRKKLKKQQKDFYMSDLSFNKQKGWIAKCEQKILVKEGYVETGIVFKVVP
jgi:hypothetical protein